MENKDYVTFEVAKLLKEKEYEQDTIDVDFWRYGDDGKQYWYSRIGAYETVDKIKNYTQRPKVTFPCPTLWDTLKWLREKHKIYVHPFIYNYKWTADINNIFDCNCTSLEAVILSKVGYYDTYEEALNEGIKEASKLIS